MINNSSSFYISRKGFRGIPLEYIYKTSLCEESDGVLSPEEEFVNIGKWVPTVHSVKSDTLQSEVEVYKRRQKVDKSRQKGDKSRQSSPFLEDGYSLSGTTQGNAWGFLIN